MAAGAARGWAAWASTSGARGFFVLPVSPSDRTAALIEPLASGLHVAGRGAIQPASGWDDCAFSMPPGAVQVPDEKIRTIVATSASISVAQGQLVRSLRPPAWISVLSTARWNK